MIRYGCRNYVGDEDCNKCLAKGFMRNCPEHCPDYDSGRKEKSKDSYADVGMPNQYDNMTGSMNL